VLGDVTLITEKTNVLGALPAQSGVIKMVDL
jgi:hypothetical protein